MKVFITGMSGTLGTALARLHSEKGDEVWGCARSEDRCLRWRRENSDTAHLVISDCVNLLNPLHAIGAILPTCDRLYHCAAIKHVDVCEENVIEALNQNVMATAAVAVACSKHAVEMVLASTDKAYKPMGVYGATKLQAEKITLSHGGVVVRFGNLIGSSGSVFKLWAEAVKRGERIKLTNPDMTRYFLPVKEAASFMASASRIRKSVSWPRMKSARMGDIALAMTGPFDTAPYAPEVIGIRPGETMHQELAEGVSSENAERWAICELLEEAGVTPTFTEEIR